jgi:hypothetical protein
MSTTAGTVDEQAVLRNYFHAKDENRPHILERVFDRNAELVIVDRAGAMSFPARTEEAVRTAPDIGLLAPVLQLLS